MNAPASWPNSSLSSSASGIAAQLSFTNGLSARSLAAWMRAAMRSLPVPVSPWISTVAVLGATRSASATTCRIAADAATSSPPAASRRR